MADIRPPALEHGIAEATLPGQATSGDGYVIRPLRDGILVAVVDGLGHGQEAAFATGIAMDTLRTSDEASVIAMMRRCHEALRMSRGAVISLALFSALDETVTWLGVGNVAGRLLRAERTSESRDETLLQRSGLLGHKLPVLQATILTLSPLDIVILSSDGIDPEFADSVRMDDSVKTSAQRILAEHYNRSDDAVVVVTRYLGRADRQEHAGRIDKEGKNSSPIT
jgi:serine/threonine protein phosphatase PrpC